MLETTDFRAYFPSTDFRTIFLSARNTSSIYIIRLKLLKKGIQYHLCTVYLYCIHLLYIIYSHYTLINALPFHNTFIYTKIMVFKSTERLRTFLIIYTFYFCGISGRVVTYSRCLAVGSNPTFDSLST